MRRLGSLLLPLVLVACSRPPPASVTVPTPVTVTTPTATSSSVPSSVRVVITVSAVRWPTVADHIGDALAAGESSVCTLDRTGADRRREAAVRGVATQRGMDRDEYPFAVCLEGGAGADVRLVPSGENRSLGGWWGNQIEDLPDGTQVQVTVG